MSDYLDWPPSVIGGEGGGESEGKPSGSRAALYKQWLRIVYQPTRGKNTRNQIDRPLYNKHITAIVEELPEGYSVFEVLPEAWLSFAADIEAGKVDVRGKDTWLVFYRRRAGYIEAATNRVSVEVDDGVDWV